MNRDAPGPLRPYRGESYHGMPALKASHWDWTVSGYIALAGLGGAAQALATLAYGRDPVRFAALRRNARLLGTASAGIGALLLIKDLKTPQRFYNMLRIFRATSPMSIGTYVLSKFAAFSALAALGEVLPRGSRLIPFTEAAQKGAAVAGAGAATYTASLLSATSTPFWAATPRALGVKFAASAVAMGAAALSLGEQLGGRVRAARPLDDVAALATLVHLVASVTARRGRAAAGVGEAMRGSREEEALEMADLVVAGALPLAAYALNRTIAGRGAGLSVAASAAVLAGGFLVRHATLHAGNASAQRPRAHFLLSRPRNRPRQLGGSALAAAGGR
jgi:protein NrfD